MTTSQINALQGLCGLLLLMVPLVWPKFIFNENSQKIYKKLKWGALLLIIPFLFAGYLGNLKDRNNDANQVKSEDENRSLTDTFSSLKSQLKAHDLVYDEKTNRILNKLDSVKVVFKDTTFGKTTVAICNEPNMRLVPTKTPNIYSSYVTFCSSSSDVENFKYSIYCFIKNSASKKYILDSFGPFLHKNDFIKSMNYSQGFTIELLDGVTIVKSYDVDHRSCDADHLV